MSEACELRFGDIEVSRHDRVAVLTINRPAKLNALRRAFWTDLVHGLNVLANDGLTGAIVLTGAGDRSFSVGGDIADFGSLEGIEALRALQQEAMAGLMAIERCPLMIIAAVNGYAIGGGCELVLACDWAFAANNATFAMPEASLGLMPGFGVIRAPQLIGRSMTKLMIATGEPIDAQRAYEIGLVQKLVPPETLRGEAIAAAGRIIRLSPNAVRTGKRLVNRDLSSSMIDYSVEAVTVLQCSLDRRERATSPRRRRARRRQPAVRLAQRRRPHSASGIRVADPWSPKWRARGATGVEQSSILRDFLRDAASRGGHNAHQP